jgi:hypothetical protein
MKLAIEKLKAGRVIRCYLDDPRCRIATPGILGEDDTFIHSNTVQGLLNRQLIVVVKRDKDCVVYKAADTIN